MRVCILNVASLILSLSLLSLIRHTLHKLFSINLQKDVTAMHGFMILLASRNMYANGIESTQSVYTCYKTFKAYENI